MVDFKIFGDYFGEMKEEDFTFDLDAMKNAGSECRSTAVETSSACGTAISKAGDLIAFGSEMKTVLDLFGDGIGIEDFTAIQNALSGDKVRGALALSKEMDDLAISCASNSLKMIDAIGVGIESLPNILEKNIDKRLENAQLKGSEEGDPDLPELEENVRELEESATEIENTNPMSIIGALQKAFGIITNNGDLCSNLFTIMKNYAEDVVGVTEAITTFDIGEFVGHGINLIKGIWRCLRLSDMIRSFANAVETVIKLLVKLIQVIIEKIFGLGDLCAQCGFGGGFVSTLKSMGINMDNPCSFGNVT